jgi:hypothetical protein
MLRSAMTRGCSGATGAACALPDMVERAKPAIAIANTVRNMCFSLVYGTSLVARGWIRIRNYVPMNSKVSRVVPVAI